MSESSKTEERVPLTIDVVPEPFEGVADCKFISAQKLAGLVRNFFKDIFVDCEGVMYEKGPYGELEMGIVFNHGKYPNGRTAVQSPYNSEVADKKDVVLRGRALDTQNRNGDRYIITEDGKDIFGPLISGRMYDNKGAIKWNKVVTEVADQNSRSLGAGAFYGFGRPNVVQFTKIDPIPVTTLCKLVYGAEDESGDDVEYGVNVWQNPMLMQQFGQFNVNLQAVLLQITRVGKKKVDAVYNELGLGQSSSFIIR